MLVSRYISEDVSIKKVEPQQKQVLPNQKIDLRCISLICVIRLNQSDAVLATNVLTAGCTKKRESTLR